jgi:hypothetical protein
MVIRERRHRERPAEAGIAGTTLAVDAAGILVT